IKVFPSNAALKIKAAELSVKIGYTEGAVKEYIEAATHYLDNGVSDKAQAFYHKAIELDPKNVAALLGLGRTAERQNNIEQALEYLKNALSIAPGNSNALLAYSSLAAKTGNTEEGRQCLIKLTEIEPSNTEYKKLLGDIYFKEGSLEKAWGQFLPYIDEAIRLQKWDEAAELLTSFRDVDPAGVRKHLITVYKGSGDKESAVKELRELAELYESENLITDTLQIYKEILELTPSDESAEKKIRELEKTGEEEVTAPEAAIIKEEPAKSLLEEKLSEADFYIQQGLKEDALKIYEKLLFLYPDDAELKSRAESLKKPEIKEEVKAKPKKHRVSYI
ncbi:MAG: tetratricopeptide repeat protein, partial [Nitrospirae bacterium]|nr:tetratricopeptide repeat protein [Nitrospirota bacterium]